MKFQRSAINTITLFIFLILIDSNPLFSLLCVDFTLCGVIFVSLKRDYPTSIVFALTAGIMKDVLCFNIIPVNTVNFFVTGILIYYLKRRFKEQKIFDYLIGAIAIFMYLLLTSFSENRFSFIFSLKFLINSWIFFVSLDNIITRWIPGLFRE